MILFLTILIAFFLSNLFDMLLVNKLKNDVFTNKITYEEFIKSLNYDPSSINIFSKNSDINIACSKKTYINAIKKLDKLKLLMLHDYYLYHLLGRTHFLIYQFNESINMFSKSIELNPSYLESYNEIYLVYNYMGEFENAESLAVFFNKTLKNEFASNSFLIENYNDFTNLTSDKLINIGRYYFLNRNYTISEKYFNRSIKIDKFNYKIYSNLGWINYIEGNLEKAERMLLKAKNLNNMCDQGYTELAQFYYLIDKLNESKEMYNVSLIIEPDIDHIYSRWGWFFYYIGELNKSKEMFKNAIKHGKKQKTYFYYVDYHNGLVLSYLKNNEVNKTISILNYSINITPNSIYKEQKIESLKLIKLGRIDKAEKILESSSKYLFDINNENIFFDYMNFNSTIK